MLSNFLRHFWTFVQNVFLLSVTHNEFVTTEALIADKKIYHEHERKIEIYNILVYFNITNFHQDFAFSTDISKSCVGRVHFSIFS